MNATTITTSYTAREIEHLINGLNIQRFNTLSAAKAAAAHCPKIQAILHGDDETFWMTSISISRKLERGGYELVAYAH